MVFQHDATGDFEPHSGTFPYFFGGKERVKDFVEHRFRNARTIVDEIDDGAAVDPR